MDAVTAVSGSGPAYFALLAEAMIEAGILLGLSREISTQLVVQTMLGTAKQLRDEKMHPVELREMVTSPGGTTIAAIRELEIGGRPRGFPQRDPGGDDARSRARGRRALAPARKKRARSNNTSMPRDVGEPLERRARCRRPGRPRGTPPGSSNVREQRADRLVVAARVAGRRAQRARPQPRTGGSRRVLERVTASAAGLVVLDRARGARARRVAADRARPTSPHPPRAPTAHPRERPRRRPRSAATSSPRSAGPSSPEGHRGQLSRYRSAARTSQLAPPRRAGRA